jgi:hypothetical protein
MDDLQAYEDLLEGQLLPELRAAASIARWFYADTDKAQRWLAEKRLVWSHFCGLLNGHISHRRLCRMLCLAAGAKA